MLKLSLKNTKTAQKAAQTVQKRVVLAGNPNAGKTTLFNALTKSNLRTGNFHGVTTSPARKTVEEISFADVPGMYSFTPYSMEEQSAIDEIKSADLVINVVDALTLENSLNLTRAIIASGVPTVVYITKYAALKRRGGKIDFEKLSSFLGVPVVNYSPKTLKNAIKSGSFAQIPQNKTAQPALKDCYSGGKDGVSKADKLFYNRFFALPFFALSVTLMFFLAFHPAMPGALLKGLCEKWICEDLCNWICAHMQNKAVISLVSEGILGGVGTVLSFVPQLAILYLVLILLDESGVTSALSFATDGLFEKARLSGRAAFSLVSGFGCTAAAILTTRGYSTVSAQKRTVAILPFIPCGAKLPVFLTFLSPLFKNPFPVITCFYFAGLAVAIIASVLIKGGGEGMLSEVTPVCLPSPKAVAIKLLFQIKSFIIKIAGVITVFCVLSWFFSHFSFTFSYVEGEGSMLAGVSRMLVPLFYPMGVTDWRLAYAALCGFIAKENVAATVALLMPLGTGLGLSASLAMCTFVLLCPACVSAFSASVREVGAKFTLKCCAAQLFLAFSGAYLVRLATLFI
ncbi:MAG: ferrous iron transporter B [Clostridia bacterium]|nr:ferrous iron transporter B [Clostridia bacterium]